LQFDVIPAAAASRSRRPCCSRDLRRDDAVGSLGGMAEPIRPTCASGPTQKPLAADLRCFSGGRPMPVPRRILVFGPSGSGKSTLARRIGERLGIPVVHLDVIYWKPGWVPVEREPFRKRVAEAAAGDAWVIDGNYNNHLDLRLPRAQAAIWLDLPRHVYFPRAVWRMIRHFGRERGDVGPGCREWFDLPFLRDWVWAYPRLMRARHAELMASLPAAIHGIVLRSSAEVAKFTSGLPGSLER
jgi:adenylate kinase family enzyme